MSQFGMQMPGTQRGRSASMNIYTGLMLVAVTCLLAAVILAVNAGMQIGPGGDIMGALTIHPQGQLKLGK